MPDRVIDDDAARQQARAVRAAGDALRSLAPDAGSYLAESDFFNEAWRDAFWGDNYARLLAIKRRYDPADLFITHHGVGSDRWSADGFSRLV